MASTESPSKTPSKSRSFSDPPAALTLAPSPIFRDRVEHQQSKDDNAVPTTPKPSRRPDIFAGGLSLHMPPRANMPSPSQFSSRLPAAAPLSPQLDQANIYMQSQSLSASPVTSLPRHSRGLDFSRACTNLHHSTLAESSPDSSPIITQRAVMIPARKGSVSSMMLDSPYMTGPGSVAWGSLAPERSAMSSSVGSVNMLGSDSGSSDSDEDASMGGDDHEDPIYTTPHVHKLQNPNAPTSFHGPNTPSAATCGSNAGGGNLWATATVASPAQISLMKTIRRTRLRKDGKRSRKSSSSASGSGYSSLASPRTTSPPPMRSIETANSGYFNWATAARSRRESLALGTDGLHLSSGNDSGDEASIPEPATPGVVRRPVTRRGNLLPKTKGFARVRAALAEEAAPVDIDVLKEAETIRQVRERDTSVTDLNLERPQTSTAQSSPNLLPAVPESAQEDFGRELDSAFTSDPSNKGLGMNFAAHASRNSGGLDYWNRFDPFLQRVTPPPSLVRQGSSVISSDMALDGGDAALWRRPRARSSASDASDAFPSSATNGISSQSPAVHDDMHLKKFKRRREDDFDIATIKRRAVSPGMSAQNSPVLTHSPSAKESKESVWGQPPERKRQSISLQREKESVGLPPATPTPDVSTSTQPGSLSQQSSRHGSGGSSVSMTLGGPLTGGNGGGGGGLTGQGKKLGLQGMVDTNDSLMKMSIE